MTFSEVIDKYADEGLQRIIMSNPRDKEYVRARVRPVMMKGALMFQVETIKGPQAFHENLSKDELGERFGVLMMETFKQAQIQHLSGTCTVLVGKKGTVTVSEKKVKTDPAEPQKLIAPHDKVKKCLIPEGTPVPFLADLGVFSADGHVIKGKNDKYRQINRFLEFIEDIVPELPDDRTINILDFGCGKSYLTFAVYYYLTVIKGRSVKITGLDLKRDVVERCEKLARSYGYDGLSFSCGDVSAFAGKEHTDLMMTLHACDTATDHALAHAVKSGASVILSVPCCQHELNAQFKDDALEPLFRYGIIRERISALATDALRAEMLSASGYKVQLLEFIDMEHTPKNILIRAVKRKHKDKAAADAARARVEAFVREYAINPKLYDLLRQEE